MTIELEVQNATRAAGVPGLDEFRTWVTVALDGRDGVSLVLRVVDEGEMRTLNARYRGHDRPTNVLSFPAELPASVTTRLDTEPIGDIVMCAPLVSSEAQAQEKPLAAHWAHLTVHGVLHLLGLDHQSEQEAQQMEAREIDCLANLGFPNPYE
jgi:probable rRNA maturation factor